MTRPVPLVRRTGRAQPPDEAPQCLANVFAPFNTAWRICPKRTPAAAKIRLGNDRCWEIPGEEQLLLVQSHRVRAAPWQLAAFSGLSSVSFHAPGLTRWRQNRAPG